MNPWQTHGGLVHQLTQQNLLSKASIIDGSLEVLDMSSRNRNFLVLQDPPLFVKVGLDEGRLQSINREAFVYQFAHELPGGSQLGSILPKLRFFDAEQGVLITEGLAESRSFTALLSEADAKILGLAGKAVGEALAKIANLSPPEKNMDREKGAPWPFRMALPEKHHFMQASAASQELIRIIQRHPNFAERLEMLRKGWKATGIVHNDLKPDNILFVNGNESNPGTAKIIDWEIHGFGDPHWDVGTLLASLLMPWIGSVEKPGSQEMKIERLASENFPFTSSFWQAYSQNTPSTNLIQAVQYAGVGLLKIAMETAELLHKPRKSHLLLLQVGSNLIQNPQSAASTLFGLEN